jgi:NitT/TauT family transport system substrate-binding protein
VAAEDTRRTRRLAADLGIAISGRVVSYYDAVETARLPELLEALREGRIDGAVTWEPFLSRNIEAVSDRPHQRLDMANLFLGHWIIAGRQQFLRDGKPAVEAALRALDDAVPLCLGENAAGKKFMIDKGLISEDEARRAWHRFRFDVTLDQGLILALEDQAAWGRRRGMGEASATPNFLRHLETAPMRKAIPDNVTVIE